jgi:hypothetical protein
MSDYRLPCGYYPKKKNNNNNNNNNNKKTVVVYFSVKGTHLIEYVYPAL